MKFVLHVFVGLLGYLPVSSQSPSTDRTYKLVTFMPAQAFYLNGGTRALFGGKSRVGIPVTLPPNTVEWYYSLTTSTDPSKDVSIDLASNMLKFVDPTLGVASQAVASLIVPTGAGVCDVYLIDNLAMLNQFLDKTYDRPAHLLSGTRENFKQGTVPIRDATNGTFYLGFRNPSGSAGIKLNVEIIAIVAEPAEKDVASQEKAKMYGTIGWKAYQSGNYTQALEYSNKALAIDSSLAWVQCNVALIHLIQTNGDAVDQYIKAIELIKKSEAPQAYFVAAIQDIDNAQLKQQLSADATLIRSLLADEMKMSRTGAVRK